MCATERLWCEPCSADGGGRYGINFGDEFTNFTETTVLATNVLKVAA